MEVVKMFFKDMNEYIEKLDLYHEEAGAGNAKAMVELGKECNWQNAFRMMVYWYYKVDHVYYEYDEE